MIGSQIAQYRILSRLGAGGMGEVYCAEDTRLGRKVALKFVHPELLAEAEARERFVFEARAVAILNHPHITTLYEFDPKNGFMSLEYVAGENLEERLAQGALPIAEGVRIGLAVCRALGHAHGRSVVHRDIKPSNILIGDDGAIKVTDFGIARRHNGSGRTSTAAVMGTSSYMCPEQIRGQRTDGRGDLFSFGVVLYRALCGRLPWSAEGLAALYAVLHETPPKPTHWRSDLPPALSALVERLLGKDAENRFDSAEEVEKLLLEVEESLSRQPAGRAEPVESRMTEAPPEGVETVERAAETTAPPGDQRPHGSSTTFPTLCRDSTSSCARSISSSGSSAPTSGLSAPASQSPSSSPTAVPTSSGSSRISRPR